MSTQRFLPIRLQRVFLALGLLAAAFNLAFQAWAAEAEPPAGRETTGAAPEPQVEFKLVAPAGYADKSPDYYDALADIAVQHSDWASACQIYNEALKSFPQHPRLRNNAAAVRDLWANAALARRQWAAALDACDNALAGLLLPAHFRKKIAYIVQTAGRAYVRDNDWVNLEAWLSQARKRFPDFPAVKALVPALYAEALAALPLTDDGVYLQEGKTLLQSYQYLQGTAQPDTALVQDWCRRLLHNLQEQKAWKRALDLLQTARELIPGDSGLRDLEITTWDILAKEYMQGKQWEFAALIYEQALDRFPRETLFMNNLKYCRQKRDQAQSTFQ